MPAALALEKSMESLLRLTLAPSRFPAASRLAVPASNLQPLTSRTSNRYSKLLELRVTHTKQTIAPRSNRYKFALFAAAISPRSRRSRLAAGTVALALNVAAALRARAALIANEMRSPARATNSQRATYDFLIANEFQSLREVNIPASAAPASQLARFDTSVIIIAGKVANAAGAGRESHRETNRLPERFTQREVSRIVGVQPGRLRYWHRLRLVVPRSRWGERFYNFRDLIALRSIKAITEHRIPAKRLCRAVAVLRNAGEQNAVAIGELQLFASGREIAAIPPGRASQAIEPLTGQFLLPFHILGSSANIRQMDSRTAGDLFEDALQCEAHPQGIDHAMRLYHRVIEMQPNWCEPRINLGCIFFQLGELENARNSFCNALELEPENVVCHFNLGCILDEIGDSEKAIEHLRRAVQLEPCHADAHFNLASAYEKCGEKQLALQHWVLYLQHQSQGPWADYARTQLNKIRSPQTASTLIPFRPLNQN
jgi:tetratricopeptide (TPR) repeat protein